MKRIQVPPLTEQQVYELDELYPKTNKPYRTRAQIVLLFAEKGLTAEETGIRVSHETVRRELAKEDIVRHFRREVTHCELFETVKMLIDASYDFFSRFNRTPEKGLSIIGAHSS